VLSVGAAATLAAVFVVTFLLVLAILFYPIPFV
jgi:hypothetical protein